MKTQDQIKKEISKAVNLITGYRDEIEAALQIRPYTRKEANAVNSLNRSIRKEQDRLAELRQVLIYIETTPIEGIMLTFEECRNKLQRIESDLAAIEDKEARRETASKRGYSEAKRNYKKMLYIVS